MATGKKTKREVEPFDFKLILADVNDITDELENQLLEAGCDDALLGAINGEVYLDFGREGESFDDAVASAIEAVESAGVTVDRVELPRAETVAMINALLKARHGDASIKAKYLRLAFPQGKGEGMGDKTVGSKGKVKTKKRVQK